MSLDQISIDDENGDLTVISCPEGQERCPIKIGVHKATLNVDEAQYAGAARHHEYMGNKEYRKECGIRAGAESLVNEIANAHDGRRSRHRNEKGSRLQLIFAGISCNVKRFVRFTQNYYRVRIQL